MSIVIPVYNEENLLAALLQRLDALCAELHSRFGLGDDDIEIIFVNDGSRDRSFAILHGYVSQRRQRWLLNLSRNYGHQCAISAGIEQARGDAVVVIDADLQDPPEFIAELYAHFLQGFDVVYAVRAQRDGENRFKLWTAHWFYRLLESISNVRIPVDTGDFRLMSRRVVTAFLAMPERHRFVRGMISWLGFRQIGLSYQREGRYAGKTKYSLTRMLRLAIDGITSFSVFPLKIATFMGLLVFITAFLYGLHVLYLAFFTDSLVHGWASIMVVMLGLGGTQLIILGVLGEYVGRVHEEVKARPLYVVEGLYSAVDAAAAKDTQADAVKQELIKNQGA